MPDKRLEKWYLEQLRMALPDFPEGPIVADEPPDFIVAGGNGAVGIELTVFHLKPLDGLRPHQEQQSLKDRIVRQAKLHDTPIHTTSIGCSGCMLTVAKCMNSPSLTSDLSRAVSTRSRTRSLPTPPLTAHGAFTEPVTARTRSGTS